MEHRRASHPTVTIPAGCRDDVVPMSDSRAEPLVSAGVGQVALSSLVAGFDWPGPDPRTHLVLATVDGAGRLLLGDREHHLVAGTVAVCPAHTPRYQWAEEPWRVVTIRLADVDRWQRFRQTGPFVLEGHDPHRFAAPALGILGLLSPTVTAVSGASRGRDPMDEFLVRFATQLNFEPDATSAGVLTEPFTLYALILRIQLEALLAEPPSVDRDEVRLHGLWEAVRRDPGKNWSVESLARHLSVSRATLHRLVAHHHHSTPGAIVDQIRMDHAARLLAHGDLPVKAVAAQVGYSTPYSFSTAFRRRRGCSPSAFRAQAGERRGA
jgi:AraC-like DNA-binding protein